MAHDFHILVANYREQAITPPTVNECGGDVFANYDSQANLVTALFLE
jgi:hypothetical protein